MKGEDIKYNGQKKKRNENLAKLIRTRAQREGYGKSANCRYVYTYI